MRILKGNSFLFFFIIFLTTTLKVSVLLPAVPEEYLYKKRDDPLPRDEGIVEGKPIGAELPLELLSAVITYQHPSLLRVDDFTNPTSLVVKLRDALDPLSQYLRERFSPDMKQRMDAYDESQPPSEVLQKALVGELNRLLKEVLYDAQRFAQVILSEKTQRWIKQGPPGKELLHLNRLLLEEAYPREIAKNQYSQEVSSEPIEKIHVGFFLNTAESSVDITVREYDPTMYYYMKSISTEYQQGFNEFFWSNRIINDLGINWHVLHATVEFKHNLHDVIAPALLYDMPLPSSLRLEAYHFDFVPNKKGDAEYEITYDGKVKFQGSEKKLPAKDPTPITWKCENASEGWYKLSIVLHFKDPSRPQESSTFKSDYEFYHKPELNISNPMPERSR